MSLTWPGLNRSPDLLATNARWAWHHFLSQDAADVLTRILMNLDSCRIKAVRPRPCRTERSWSSLSHEIAEGPRYVKALG